MTSVLEETVLKFESHPERSLHVWLFTDVTNSKQIGEDIQNRKLPRDFSFINAAYVADLFVVHLSASKALFAETAESLRAKKLHGELIVNLSGSKHVLILVDIDWIVSVQIASSLLRYGASESVKHFLIAAFDATKSDSDFLASYVKGIQQPITKLTEYSDIEQIKKNYKITKIELELGSLADAAACRVATHDVDKIAK